jgi:hypothetical protein
LYNLNEVIMRSSVGYGSYAMDGMFGDEIDELGPPPQLYTEAIEVGPESNFMRETLRRARVESVRLKMLLVLSELKQGDNKRSNAA